MSLVESESTATTESTDRTETNQTRCCKRIVIDGNHSDGYDFICDFSHISQEGQLKDSYVYHCTNDPHNWIAGWNSQAGLISIGNRYYVQKPHIQPGQGTGSLTGFWGYQENSLSQWQSEHKCPDLSVPFMFTTANNMLITPQCALWFSGKT